MKQTLNVDEMVCQLLSSEDTYFSIVGARALAQHLDDNHDDNEEFNTTVIRGQFTEYRNLIEFAEQQFGDHWRVTMSIGDLVDDETAKDLIKNVIEECTCYIEFDGGVIVENF